MSCIVDSDAVYGIATESTITMGLSSGSLSVDLVGEAGGNFEESDDATITVRTDNFTGYNLSVRMSGSTDLSDGNGHAITSISSAISEQTFVSGSAYNNKWGFKPSQYVTTSGGINSVVNNTDFLPAPSLEGMLLDETSAANSTNNTYTFSFGAKVDNQTPPGNYVGTYIVTAVVNSIVYNVTYDANAGSETVTNMPTPNPQTTTIDGGTAAADSYVTLSDMTPVRNDKKFAGWCDVATTTDTTTGDDTCSGTLYEAGDDLPIDQTAAPNITLYAVWVDTLFPIVWNQMGACEFHGATNDNITGSACTDYHDVKFIDTGVALYSQANYLKDFEIHFTLDHYLPSEQVNYFGSEDNGQQTFVNDKLGSHAADGKAPGVTVRRATSNIDFNSKFGDEQEKKEIPYAQVHDVSMFRLDNKIYYSYDGRPLVFLQDITGFSQQFDLTTWFGAYPRDDCDGSQGPCTNAKRIPEATMSNMYIRLGKYSDDDIHTINFKRNDDTTTTEATYLIKDGNSLTMVPADPTYVNHLFQGWFTAQSGGTQITASTVPSASADYYAHWLGTVAIADIDNPVITLEPNETETIVVNNASELEPYTFSSSNDNVATVNQTTGEITATGPGTVVITMTGTTSGETQTIDVTVTGQVIHVSFDSQGGTPASYTWDVGDGSSFSTLPVPTKEDHEFAGWWTGTDGSGTELTTSTVFDENTPTQYYANWTELIYVCKIAKTLHSETCSKSNGNGCRKAGWASDAIIEYGHLVSKAEETHGAAYNCDVDFDGTHDPDTERFYYFGTENGNAKFIHYKNMPDNSTDELNPSVAYTSAIALLPNYELDQQNPLVPVWDNPHLVTHTSGAYAGKAARFMTYPEITGGLWSGGTNHVTPSDPVSTYLFEQSNFATNNATDGIWLEEQPSFKNRIQTNSLTLTHGSTSANAARATIDVPVEYVEPYVETETYDITFDPHNETNSWTETIDAGDDLSDVYPATDPSYTNHLFQGWFTAATGGSQISSSTEPSGDATYHAQWLGTVALATVADGNISVTTGSTATVTVTNAANLEGFSFSSSDPNVATIDSSTGVITPVAAGTTNISITGATSSTTNQIATVTVTVPVVQYTVYFNPHNGEPNSSATVTAGQQIGSSNIPADPTPSGTDEVFMGWFTEATGGTAVDGTTTPSADGETYHAQYKKIVCKVETSSANLHTHDTNVAYGQIASSTTPQAGDAYNCDVDYDDTYSSANERFYYVGQDSNNNAVLVAWNSYYGGAWAPGTSNDTLYSYTDALGQLPANTSGAWDNPGLIEQEPGKAARFTSRDELASACNTTLSGLTGTDAIVPCDYFMEHSAYDGNGRSALWLVKEGSSQYRIHTGSGNRKVSTSTGTSMVRPTIVVPDKLIEKYTPALLDVTNAIIANNDLTTTVGGNFTIIVSNSAELEPYTFSSANTSIATVDASGVITGVSAGTTNIIMTGTTSGLTKTLEVDITAAPTVFHTVTFNPNGGSFSDPNDSSKQVADGTAVGALPTPTKANHMFFGWYKDDGTLYQEVYPEEVIDDTVTYYAKWVESTSSFPIVWAETNACTFNGTSNITGDYCLEDAVSGNSIDKTKHYIDTAIQLFTQANFQKDFEVGLNIVSFDGSSSTNQATFVTSKAENLSGWPGFTLRRATTTGNLEFTERFSMNSQAVSAPLVAISSVNRVKIARIGEKIYYSWNDAPYTLLQDISANTTRFDTKVWFGATLNSAGTGSQRPIFATFTDMYIKLGAPTDYVIELDVNDGAMSDPSSFTVPIGSQLGTLPTPTPPNENYIFVGWFDESVSPAVQVTSTTVPDGNKVYVAHYAYDSSDEPVVFNIANDALQGYQTLINGWVQSPVNITTFNQSSPINDSTWGDTGELSEKQFWEGIKGNFENNLCSIPSYSDAVKPLSSLTNWGNGSVDCSKPRAYDTKIGAALNVYLNDKNGAQVAYANATNGVIHNMIPGQTYYWEKADDSTVYGYVTATSVNGRRPIELSANRNTRDLGGLPVTYTDSNNQTVTGTLAYGRLFRGERLWSTPATELYNLGINKQYDVGDPTEYANDTKLSDYQWDPVVHYNFDYNSGDENNASSNYMKAWTAVTDIMTDITSVNDPKNIYFHCRVGADRTGTTAYLLEGLLGVPDEARYEEYELTNLSGLYDRTRYYKQKTSTNNLKFVFMMEYVKTNADILNWYMSNPNSDMNLVQAFRSAMTVTGGGSGGSGQQNVPVSPQMSPMNLNNTNNATTNSATNNAADGTGDDSSSIAKTEDIGSSYTAPQGVSELSDDLADNSTESSSATGLIVAAAVATAAGATAFGIMRKNRD